MAQADGEMIRALLTDTVTLLCRNSLSFDKSLKVQGLFGITVDETEVYIVQINEEFGDGGQPETLVQSVSSRSRDPSGSNRAKRARISGAARIPNRRTVQGMPSRMSAGVGAVSPASAQARQKARQQISFHTPQKIIPQMADFSAASSSPGNMRPGFARDSPMSNSQGSAISQAFTQAASPIFQQAPRMPSNQKPAPFCMIEDKAKVGADLLSTVVANQVPRGPMPKVQRPDSFGQRPVKVEKTQGDIICVESDEENSDAKRAQSLLPFLGAQQSTVEGIVDNKTVTLQAIMAEALNQARSVGSGSANSLHDGGLYPVKSERQSQLTPGKTETVSSSQSIETEMTFDVGEGDVATQFRGGAFATGLDMKPVFDKNPMQNPWEATGSTQQSMNSPTYGRPASRSKFSAQWFKTEEDQGRGTMATSITPTISPFFQSPDLSRAFSSPPQNWGQSGVNFGSSGAMESIDSRQQQDMAGTWKSVTSQVFICNIDNCNKEFTTKRSMRRHQRTLHGVASKDGGDDDSDSDLMQQQLQDSRSWTSVTTTRFICSIDGCNKEFTTKRSMRRHQRTLHGMVSADGGDGNSDPSSTAAFQCEFSDD